MGLPEEEGVGQRDADGVPAQPRTRPVPQRELGGLLGGGPVPSPPRGVFREFRQTPARRCGETIHTFLPPSRMPPEAPSSQTSTSTNSHQRPHGRKNSHRAARGLCSIEKTCHLQRIS